MTKADDREARRQAQLNAKGLQQAQRFILGEYDRLGRDPVYAGDMLVSPELADKLNPAGALYGNE